MHYCFICQCIIQNHVCFSKCFDAFEDQGWWWLVLENAASGDLYSIVHDVGHIRYEGWLVSQVGATLCGAVY